MRFDSGERFDDHHQYDSPTTPKGKIMLAKLSRSVKHLAIPAKIKRLREVAVAVAAQPYGTTVAAQATALTAGLTKLDTDSGVKDAASAESTRTTKVQTASNDAVNILVEQFFTGIESATLNDPVQLATTTVDLQTSPGKSPAVGPLAAPINLHVSTGDFPGTSDAHADRVHGATGYAWRHNTDPNNLATWVNGPSTTKSSTTHIGLLSGTKYYHQTAAIGSAGQSPWSDIASGMAS